MFGQPQFDFLDELHPIIQIPAKANITRKSLPKFFIFKGFLPLILHLSQSCSKVGKKVNTKLKQFISQKLQNLIENTSMPTESRNITVLIAPLDWGLGHATRCIPIIKELYKYTPHIIIAGSGLSIQLLQTEFPNAEFISLKGYNLTYPRNGKLFIFKIFTQIPKILIRKYQEQKQIRKLAKARKIDLIISDNRPGIFHKSIYSVYITHQITVKTGNRLLDRVASGLHHSVIKKFKECWVPDDDIHGLSGALSHTFARGISQKFIGPLSRMYFLQVPKVYDYCIVLSGPEPQRTILEEKIISQLNDIKNQKKILLVRGLPGETKALKVNSTIIVENHLTASKLNEALCASDIVISRCGYSTIMDLTKLSVPGILIPTPGQAEQEYLGSYLTDKKYFLVRSQSTFSISEAIASFRRGGYRLPEMNFDAFKETLSKTLQKVSHTRDTDLPIPQK